MRAILRGWWSITRAITLVSPSTSTHPWPHAVGRRGAVAIVIVAMITSLWATLIKWGKKQGMDTVLKCNLLMSELFLYRFTIVMWMVSQKSRLPLTFVGIGIGI